MANDTKTLTSEKGEIIPLEKKKWLQNQIEFLKPLILVIAGFYFVPLLATIGQEGHFLQVSDFYPSREVIQSIIVYLAFGSWDYLRKWAGEATYIVKK